ncbi:MAG: hypothetical protein QW500_00360 [Candidatus Micrarchaeia archaeon]
MKKPKIVALYPADITSNVKGKLYSRFITSLEFLAKDGYNIKIVGRIPEYNFRKLYPTFLPYIDFFDSDILNRKLTKKEIEDAENFVGYSFNYMFFSNQKRWWWLRKCQNEKIAKYVYAWKEILKEADVLIPTLDNLFFIHTAEGVADKLGLKVIKIIRGRLVNDSQIFWDVNNMPIYYKRAKFNEILQRFQNRTLIHKEIVKPSKNAINNPKNLLTRFINTPYKLVLQFSNPHRNVDIDVPPVVPKYIRLLSIGFRYLIYPTVHSLFFDYPKKDEKYFLFTLHYEWEAQLAYREPFVDQLKIANLISEILPGNTYLYIKVHPHWKNADQSLQEVFFMSRKKNIRFIHPSVNTSELIKKSMGVIVLNSTVGYEALLFKKPLIVLGHEAYRDVGIDIKDFNKLPKLLMRISGGEYRVNEDEYERFLKNYTSNIFALSIEDSWTLAKELKKVINYLIS